VRTTKKSIRRLIREFIEDLDLIDLNQIPLDYTPPKEEISREFGKGGDAKMARGQLFHIAKNSQSLHDKLEDEDQLPEWAQSKIAVIKSMLDAVHDHLDYKMHREDHE